MLFKLKNKIANIQMINLYRGFLISLYLLITQAEASEQDFQYHGFLAQGLIDVNGSDFVNDDGSLTPKLTEVGINASYELSANLRLAGQVVYLNGGNRYAEGVRVDYALLDWLVYNSPNWRVNAYFGRFKNIHWLYSSSKDIPFARPSIILPQSVYYDGFRDIAVGSDGLALKISHSNENYGDFDFNLSYGSSPISTEQTDILLTEIAKGTFDQEYELQASLFWKPAFSPWRFGLSLLDSDFNYVHNANQGPFEDFSDSELTFQFHTINALYEGELWEFSGEAYLSRFTLNGFHSDDFHSDAFGQGYYVQSRYKVKPNFSLLARYENFYQNKDDKKGYKLEANSQGAIPNYFAFHKDITLGAAYDISSNVQMRVEYHWVKGGARLTPVVLPNPEKNNSENWQIWAIQLMYWF